MSHHIYKSVCFVHAILGINKNFSLWFYFSTHVLIHMHAYRYVGMYRFIIVGIQCKKLFCNVTKWLKPNLYKWNKNLSKRRSKIMYMSHCLKYYIVILFQIIQKINKFKRASCFLFFQRYLKVVIYYTLVDPLPLNY